MSGNEAQSADTGFCVEKYDIAVFLLTLEDAVDTSDFIFNVHDNEYPEHLILQL